MTAATVTTRLDGPVLAEENVILTVSDGETFVSKLSKPELCQITFAEDIATASIPISYTISGRTVTIYADGVSDKKMAVTVKGLL